jgi:hypothetical protein
MNTVLKYLRAVNHPNTVSRLFTYDRDRMSGHAGNRGGSNGMTLRFNTYHTLPFLEIKMDFHFHCERYEFVLYEDVFIFERWRIDGEFPTDPISRFTDTKKQVAYLPEIPYTDLEPAIFQYSLLNSLGMFGAQEAEMLLKIRNTYFGRLELESTSK